MIIRSILVLLSVALFIPSLSEAAPAAKGKMGMTMEEPSKETRAKMVTMHVQMADCLKSDKKFSDCHQQMMGSCPMMKEGKCPMMMDHSMMKSAPAGGSSDHSHH